MRAKIGESTSSGVLSEYTAFSANSTMSFEISTACEMTFRSGLRERIVHSVE